MPIPEKYMVDFEEYKIYHVYNRTNNNEKLFRSDHNRNFFLNRYKKYISYLADCFCWCLLSNHFHFLIRIKSEKSIRKYLRQQGLKNQTVQEKRFLANQISCSELVESAFKRMFQSYAMAFNKCYKRNGNLFYKPFKRVLVDKESQFTQAIIYIHANPVKHGLVDSFELYKWSSWNRIMFDAGTDLMQKELFQWFGSKKMMIQAHHRMTEYYYQSEISLEE